jgi:hypothetical protein
MGWKQRAGMALSSPWLVVLNVLLCATAVRTNTQEQLFCRPVTWAAIVLVVTILPVVTYNLYRDRITKGNGPVFFLFGIAACVCMYSILFLGPMNLFALPVAIFGVPVALLAYSPHFLLVQILFHRSRAPHHVARRSFQAGVLLCTGVALFMGTWFRVEHGAMENAIADPDRSTELEPSYMTERMLGLHFKYHTALNLFDGWRPPLHDPLIVTAMWINYPFMDTPRATVFRKNLLRGGGPFLHTSPWQIEERIAAYKRVFPARPIREECSCAKRHSSFYLNDTRLQ